MRTSRDWSVTGRFRLRDRILGFDHAPSPCHSIPIRRDFRLQKAIATDPNLFRFEQRFIPNRFRDENLLTQDGGKDETNRHSFGAHGDHGDDRHRVRAGSP